jgi:drug/metabolite transporter (DMT)-like permease
MTTTIQATAKRIKLHMLLAALLMCVGVVLIVWADQPAGHLWGAGLSALGLAWFIGAKVAAWWHHG